MVVLIWPKDLILSSWEKGNAISKGLFPSSFFLRITQNLRSYCILLRRLFQNNTQLSVSIVHTTCYYFLFQRKLFDSQVCQCCRTSSIYDGNLSLLLLLELQHDLQQTQAQEIPMVIREMHIIDSLLIII